MVKALESYGLVYRERDRVDGRVSRVYLTSKGRELHAPVEQIWRKQQEKLLEGILPEDRVELCRIMKLMANNLY
ncbi:transcriptional regulator SlyA [compost metagenome]